jgi:hypothetical protein
MIVGKPDMLLDAIQRKKIAEYGAAAAEAGAGLATIGGTLSPQHAKPLIATAGALWSFAGAGNAISNNGHSLAQYGAAMMNGAAGVTDLAAGLVSGATQANLGYASSVTWGVNAVSNVVTAAADTGSKLPARIVRAAGGVANLGGAVANGVATHLASKGETTAATKAQLASGALWVAGAAAQAAGVWLDRRNSAPNHADDLELNQVGTQVNRPVNLEVNRSEDPTVQMPGSFDSGRPEGAA